jgi:hypothetical protein
MNNKEVDFYMTTNPLTREFYGGCIARDMLSRIKNAHNKFFIVNLSKRSDNDGGTHWILLSLVYNRPTYFDSSGNKPLYREFYEFFEAQGYKTFDYNASKLQSPSSIVCGYYVCLFALKLCAGWQLPEIRLKYFGTSTAVNDRRVMSVFRKYFHINAQATRKNRHYHANL